MKQIIEKMENFLKRVKKEDICINERNHLFKLLEEFESKEREFRYLKEEINLIKDILRLDSENTLEDYITNLYHKVNRFLDLDFMYFIKKNDYNNHEIIFISEYNVDEEDISDIKRSILKTENIENVRFLSLKIGDNNKILRYKDKNIKRMNIEYYDYLKEIGIVYQNYNGYDNNVNELLEIIISILHHKISIEEIYNLEEKLKKDGMTNLYNKKTFEDILLDLIKNNYKKNRFCVIMVDLNDFKNVNDRFGHSVGDEIIIRTGKILEESFRSDDLVARLGGDEFGVIIKNVNIKQGMKLANRFIERIKEEKVEVDSNVLKIKLAIGIVEFPEHGETKSEIQELVDNAMYISKSKGDYYLEVGRREIQINNKDDNDINIIEIMEDAIEGKNRRRVSPIYDSAYSVKENKELNREVFLSIDNKGEEIRASRFINHANRNGLINDLQIKLLEEVNRTYKGDIPLSYNISLKDIYNENSNFLERLFKIYKKSEFLLEFNERDFYSKQLLFLERNNELYERYGYKIIIDDYGINNSNYMYLSKMRNIDSIKISMRYLRSELVKEVLIKEYLKSLIMFATALSIKVIVKFVENESDYNIISEIRSDNLYYQGYYKRD